MTEFNLVHGPAAFAVDQRLSRAAGPCDRQHIFSYREHCIYIASFQQGMPLGRCSQGDALQSMSLVVVETMIYNSPLIWLIHLSYFCFNPFEMISFYSRQFFFHKLHEIEV